MARPRPAKLRTLVLSVDIGAGHRMAAEALCAAIEAELPGSESKLLEALEYSGPDGGKFAKDLYFGALKTAPEAWGAIYAQKGLFELFRPLNQRADDFRLGKLAPEVRAFAPDVILAMHPTACGLASSLVRTGQTSAPVAAVLTDFDAHPAWVYEGIELYLTATSDVARTLRAQRLPSGQVVATGLPIRLGFERRIDAADARRRLGLAEGRFTALLLGGGLGLGPIAETMEALVALGAHGPERANMQLVVMAGRNEELERSARALAARASIPLHVAGLVSNVWDYMSAADVALGKPGGLTCAELLATGVPLVALAPIPGQEQANCDALVALGAAVSAPQVNVARAWVRDLMEKPTLRAKMRDAALAIGRPEAAREAALQVIALVEAKGERPVSGASGASGGARVEPSEDPIEAQLRALRKRLGL